MGKYLLPIEAEEVVQRDSFGNVIATVYEITGTDDYRFILSGSLSMVLDKKHVDPSNRRLSVVLGCHEYLEEIFETDVIAIRTGDSQLETKFIIDLFGELGCKFKDVVQDQIKDGYISDNFLYGNIEKGTLFRAGSLQIIEDCGGENHETVDVEEIYLDDFIQRVRDKNRGQI